MVPFKVSGKWARMQLFLTIQLYQNRSKYLESFIIVLAFKVDQVSCTFNYPLRTMLTCTCSSTHTNMQIVERKQEGVHEGSQHAELFTIAAELCRGSARLFVTTVNNWFMLLLL